ncbi:MAG: hypothetical protein ACOH5I_17985 [Oligoflexus sp.]
MYRLMIASLIMITACEKSSKSEMNGTATVVAQSNQGIVVQIDASIDQWINLSFVEGLQDHLLVFPAGSLSNSVKLRVIQDFDLLANGELQESFSLEQPVAIASRKPSLLVEPILAPGESVQLNAPFFWQIPSLENRENWSALALEDGEDDRRILRWKPVATDVVAPALRFDFTGFGSFQLLETDAPPTEVVEGSAGSGSWWGYEINLFQAAVNASQHSVSLWQLLFDDGGTISDFLTDGESLSPLPGLSFEDSSISHPYIYDSSDETGLRPWIFSKRSLYGVMFTSSSLNQGLVGRILQRQQWQGTDLPESLDPASLVGSYQGLAVGYTAVNDQPQASPKINADAVEISYSEGQLSLTGRIAGYSDIAAQIVWPVADERAARLGIMKTTINSQGKDMPLTLFVSLDRRAIGYIVCHAAVESACGDGNGGGGLEPLSFDYGILEIEPN